MVDNDKSEGEVWREGTEKRRVEVGGGREKTQTVEPPSDMK